MRALVINESEIKFRWHEMGFEDNFVEEYCKRSTQNNEDATSPTHYSRWKIQPLDFISQNGLDFLRGNIIKYIMRYDAKNGVEDLQKAKVYLEKLIENELEKSKI